VIGERTKLAFLKMISHPNNEATLASEPDDVVKRSSQLAENDKDAFC
jgi:hypothetical protein